MVAKIAFCFCIAKETSSNIVHLPLQSCIKVGFNSKIDIIGGFMRRFWNCFELYWRIFAMIVSLKYMAMYKYLFTLLLGILLSSVSLHAQVDNYALKFTDGGEVRFGAIAELDNLPAYTIQFWMCVAEWKQGSAVYSRGDSFAARMGAEGELLFVVGADSVVAVSPDIAVGKWVHLSFVNNKGQATLLVNNRIVKTETRPLVIPESLEPLKLGGHFSGRIDEFRIWGTALFPDYNYMWQNTLNKFHPQWNKLITYYKFDQNLCPNVVDYTFCHHGSFSASGVSRELVADNAAFTYFTVAAYTDFSRFADRGIDRDKYLLANTLIVLGIASASDGSATLPYPFNQGTVTYGGYLAEYKGRKGVLSLKGEGARMDVGPDVLRSATKCTLRSWIYLESWTEGAFLFKKETSPTKGFSIRLGTAAGRQLIVRKDGKDYIRKGKLPVGKWFYWGDTFDVSNVGQTPTVVGENLHAKLDNTVIWSRERDAGSAQREKAQVPMPGFDVVLPQRLIHGMDSYWSYDDPADVGYDSYSYKHFLGIMRSAYDGHRGFKIKMSVSGHSGWETTFADEAKRQRLGREIAGIANESDFDGVDLDFEWVYSEEGWLNYAKVVEEIRKHLLPGKLLTVTPHKVAYKFPLSYMKYVDYFLFQIYGPNDNKIFTRSGFEEAYNLFIKWGYPKEKIVMSYATTTTGGYDAQGQLIKVGTTRKYPPVGVCNLFDSSYNPDQDCLYDKRNDCYRYITGYNQTLWRSDFVRTHGLKGIFYWDMGNDVKTSHPYSLAKAASYSLDANVDTLVTKVNLPPR